MLPAYRYPTTRPRPIVVLWPRQFCLVSCALSPSHLATRAFVLRASRPIRTHPPDPSFTARLRAARPSTIHRTRAPQNAYQAWCDTIDFKNKTIKCVRRPLPPPLPPSPLFSLILPVRLTPRQMPATPPLPFDTPSTSGSPPANPGAGARAVSPTATDTATKARREHVGARNPGITPFSLRYDRLVVAVGAYNQSECDLGVSVGGMGADECGWVVGSVRRAGGEGEHVFLEGSLGCEDHMGADARV